MYKTIVVHVDGSPQQDSRMAAAARLAREHGAHLVGSAATGISWTDYLLLTGSMAAPVPPADFDGLRETAALHLRAFTDRAAKLGVASVETRLIEDTADGALLLQARYADLVVLSRDVDPEPGIPPRVRRLPEHVALRGPRPVLVVPPAYADAPIAATVVAGWDGSTQALRALAAALPLLARADGVRLVLVNPDRLSDAHGEQPGADMALYLARHGVKVDVVLERTHATAGDALMALARTAGAGLIVAGAYGHSRYREWVLGGVTRELLERAPVPLLLAH
ncbi:universal stress protein [Massilia orientalis]|jgi:nucleotide-binding universal stress UspA family protein|uniref:Universal stress protein n=1 Tax=Massilia orientalis TaxID=3050128 RepID=A0ACC7M841_9BURK|nr:universal stress protein [Massilia sp. YIM B02787]